MDRGNYGFATLIALKYKDYYDKTISFAWLTRDEGLSGAVFRMRDEYNFYYFGLNKDRIEFGIVQDGNRKVL